jgi:hypothetical protein
MKHQYTEEDIMQALDTIAHGDSIRKASLELGVPRTTLQSRIYSHESHQIASEIQQKLAPVQEKRLVDWVLVQESLGLGLTHLQIKDFAQWLLAIQGDTTTLGKRWIQGFMKRNPILKTKKQYQINSTRVNRAIIDIIKSWF